MKKIKNNLNGWLILDKPVDMSSADAVGRVKRILKPAKIGHGGTLDPMASGILPLAFGEATKTFAYMVDLLKTYDFTVTWGEERDTDDAQGKVIATSDSRPDAGQIAAAMAGFKGFIQQVPPRYSAIKVDGQRAYALARAGEEVELEAREVYVDNFDILEQNLPASTRFTMICGKGTYVRSVAHDLGRKLGCYGYISALRRTSVGKFTEAQAISLENLENLASMPALEQALYPVDAALDDIPAIDADEWQANTLKRGQGILAFPTKDQDSLRRVVHQGKLVAVVERNSGQWKPVRVFNY